MKYSTLRRAFPVVTGCLFVASILLVKAPQCAAQATGNSMVDRALAGPQPLAPTPEKGQVSRVPPAALPGAASDSSRVTPSDHSVAGMEPSDALFDAINRGDLGAARDAVNRGADLRARNILGMTPMELSVDLNRNDISFMLLSERGASSGGSGAASMQAAGKGAPGKPPVKQAQRRPPPKANVAMAKSTTPAVPQTATLFAGNGGTPNPSAGFLGFDAGRGAPQ